MGVWRNPLVPVGLLLVAVGLGNWYAARDKTVAPERIMENGVASGTLQQYQEFDKLTARTNATLLRPFQQGADESTLLQSKLDFYRVVRIGGRVLILLGIFSAIAGMIHSWYQVRLTARAPTLQHHQ